MDVPPASGSLSNLGASPYHIDIGPGLTHIRMAATGECIGDCRTDVYLILRQEIRMEALREAAEAAERAAVRKEP